MNRKGIVLAGGFGTRLHPLTQVMSKQLLPVYDKPMVFYPLGTLKQMGVTDVAIIVKKGDKKLFKHLLGDGSDYGMSLTYFTQEHPNGIAEAFIICEEFIGDSDVALILGDNVFCADMSIMPLTEDNFTFGYKVKHPERYGVVVHDKNSDHVTVVEKPREFVSDTACVGLYCLDNTCVKKAKQLQPSDRGELEIADLLNMYPNLCCYYLPETAAWFDCGDIDELNECSNYLRALKKRTNIKLGL